MLISYFFASASGGRRPPDHVSGLCPWTPLGDFRLAQPPTRPLFSIIPNPPCELHPIVKSWVRLWLRGQKMRGAHWAQKPSTGTWRGLGVASGEEKRGTGQQSPQTWKPCNFCMPESGNSPHFSHFRYCRRQAPTPSTQNASDLQQCQEQLRTKVGWKRPSVATLLVLNDTKYDTERGTRNAIENESKSKRHFPTSVQQNCI